MKASSKLLGSAKSSFSPKAMFGCNMIPRNATAGCPSGGQAVVFRLQAKIRALSLPGKEQKQKNDATNPD